MIITSNASNFDELISKLGVLGKVTKSTPRYQRDREYRASCPCCGSGKDDKLVVYTSSHNGSIGVHCFGEGCGIAQVAARLGVDPNKNARQNQNNSNEHGYRTQFNPLSNIGGHSIVSGMRYKLEAAALKAEALGIMDVFDLIMEATEACNEFKQILRELEKERFGKRGDVK